MDKLYIYTRVSTQEQAKKGNSLDVQKEAGKKVAKKLGFKAIVVDEGGQSSTIGYREKLEEVIKVGIDNGEIKNLWVFDRSRLFRDFVDAVIFRKDYLENRVNCYEGINGELIDFENEDSSLAYDLISRIQQAENEKRKAKSQEGKRRFLRKGTENKHYGGTVLFGYKTVNGFLEIEQEEAKWVRFMFKSILQGKSLMDIIDVFKTSGVKARRSAIWNTGTLTRMLRNRAYIGEQIYIDKELKKKGEQYEFKYKIHSIVDRKLFLKVQTELNKRTKQTDRNKKHYSLLSDLMICECGTSIGSIVKSGKRKTGEKFDTRQYYCNSRSQMWKKQKKSTCINNKSMQMDKTDAFLVNEVKKVVADSHLLKEKFKTEILEIKNQNQKEINAQQKKLEEKCKRINKSQTRTKDNIVSLETNILQGRAEEDMTRKIINSLYKELDAYDEELSNTETEINNLSSKQEWLDWVKKYGETVEFQSKNAEVTGEWIRGLVNKITVNSEYGEDKRTKKNKQLGHSFHIEFNMKVVKDELIYKDESKKSLGYEIKEGKNKSKTESVNLTADREKRSGKSKKKAG